MPIIRKITAFIAIFLIFCLSGSLCLKTTAEEPDYIKWVDFKVSHQAMAKCMEYDIATYETGVHLHWIEMLAYLGGKYGGDFSKYREKDLKLLVQELSSGKSMSELSDGMTYYAYYFEAYSAVLDGFIGEYSVEVPGETEEDEPVWESRYGLKAFSPIANGFPFDHYDDFGTGRTYGYRRRHLGHDIFGQIGTPIIAIESGIVECMGWNRYGGWRLGIRSLDGKRYYYYAHLRQNRPYHCDLQEGQTVKAGDVIGYMGRTGYSTKENVNNIEAPHLHVGIQLIFHSDQKDCNSEIWIDVYAITKLLQKNKSLTYRTPETKEHYRQQNFDEPILHAGLNPLSGG